MVFEIILSVFLGIYLIISLIPAKGNIFKGAARGLVILAGLLLWGHYYLFIAPDKHGFWGILMMIFFWVFFVILTLITLISSMRMFVDRERVLGPYIMGNPDGKKKLLAVFHPGGSAFSFNAFQELSNEVKDSDIRIELYSAHKGLTLDMEGVDGLIIGSPIYGGKLSSSIESYLQRAAIAGKKIYLYLTGSVPERTEADLNQVVSIVESRGGQAVAGTKIIMSQDEKVPPVSEQARPFADKLKESV